MHGGRKLTEGEIRLARSVFGDSIDYSTVILYNGKHNPFQPDGISMAPNGRIYFNGGLKDDFSKEDVLLQAHFIHEMAHIWQFQNNVLHPVLGATKELLRHGFNYAKAYVYDLSKGKDLTDFGLEEQACIIEHMFVLRADPSKNPDKYARLCKVLENFLRDPSYARRPAKGVAKILKKISGQKP